MSRPTAAFNFNNSTGLSVNFSDRSSGVINTYSWDFGHRDISNVQVISNVKDPGIIVFPAPGIYKVILTVSNSEGSSTSIFDMVLSETPTLNNTITDMVKCDLPGGISFDTLCFSQSIRKWQLFLQSSLDIKDIDVFNQTKWPPLANALIAKLIIYDLIEKAAQSSMLSVMSSYNNLNLLSNQITTGTFQVADYTYTGIIQYPAIVNLIIIDGVSFGPSLSLNNSDELLTYLNSLIRGHFAISGNSISTLGNSYIISTFNYTDVSGGVNGAFVQSNARVIPINQTIQQSGSTSTGFKGPLKKIETGPSNAEWYDGSTFWSSIFKNSTGSLKNGMKPGGIFGLIVSDICMYAQKLRVPLPMCDPLAPMTTLFKVGHLNRGGCIWN